MPCRDRPRARCSRRWDSPASSSSSPSSSARSCCTAGRSCTADGVAHRFYRGSRLRAVDAAGRCRSGLGRADGGRPHARHSRRSARARSTSRASRRASCCRTWISSPAERALHLGTERSPLELGLAWLVDFDKGHFTGRRALLAEQRRGVRRCWWGSTIEGKKPAHNALLYDERGGRRQVGSVTSATWSPTCKRNIALAMLDAPHFAPGREVWAEIYLNRELVWERRMVRARVVERPFFAPERRRPRRPRTSEVSVRCRARGPDDRHPVEAKRRPALARSRRHAADRDRRT